MMKEPYHKWHEPEHLRKLEDPEREQWMPKAPVLAALHLEDGGIVADIGAGLGYFTFPIATAVGQRGRVIAVDPSPAAITELERRAQAAAMPQVTAQAGTAESTGLDAQSLDRVLWHVMYHEVSDRAQAIDEMRRILKPGGRWVVVDWRPDATLEKGPPLEHRLDAETAVEEVVARGFRVVERLQPGPVTWGFVVAKR